MNINHSEYTIAELADKYNRKELTVNRQYQRSGGIWPPSAQTYFLDTVLEAYPFPKLYFYQTFNKQRNKPVMEVVDGQQRLLTIIDFLNGDIRLSKASSRHYGKRYPDLSDEESESFLMYRVPVDVILAAQRPELLEMFRRMNAYTAPLNSAERRHSKYQGRFKWFVVELSDKLGPILEEFGILTTKQILRMGDADLIAELVLVLERGLINRSESEIMKLYTRYDQNFANEETYASAILEFFDILTNNLSELRNTYLMRPYAVHSLFAARSHIRRGIPNGEQDIGYPSRGKEIRRGGGTVASLLEIADAHETKDVEGKYGVYVSAALSTTTKVAQRKSRTSVLAGVIDPG